jgi:hypothetical protein
LRFVDLIEQNSDMLVGEAERGKFRPIEPRCRDPLSFNHPAQRPMQRLKPKNQVSSRHGCEGIHLPFS